MRIQKIGNTLPLTVWADPELEPTAPMFIVEQEGAVGMVDLAIVHDWALAYAVTEGRENFLGERIQCKLPGQYLEPCTLAARKDGEDIVLVVTMDSGAVHEFRNDKEDYPMNTAYAVRLIIARARERYVGDAFDRKVATEGVEGVAAVLYDEAYILANDAFPPIAPGAGEEELQRRKDRAAELWEQVLPGLEEYAKECRESCGPVRRVRRVRRVRSTASKEN